MSGRNKGHEEQSQEGIKGNYKYSERVGLEESVRGIEITKQPEDSQVSIRHLLVTNNYISETKIQTAFCICVTHELTSEVQVPIQLIN